MVVPISIPNPFFEGDNTVYLVPGEPLTLIDTGVATDEAFDALVQGLRDQHLEIADIEQVVLTHRHIDHIGNAWRFQQAGGAEIWIHTADALPVTQSDDSVAAFRELAAERMRYWCVPDDVRDALLATGEPRWQIESAEVRELSGGDSVTAGVGRLEVLHTPGHTMGSICLRYGTYVFTGDHVLGDVSPNIGGGDLAHRDLLRHYLESLALIRERADREGQGLPGHGLPLERLALRCEELRLHHEARLEQTHQLLVGERPQHVYEIANQLYGELQSFHIVLGCAEAEAHLEYLAEEGRVRSEQGLYTAG